MPCGWSPDFARNDLSFAAAHGLELTFSSRNLVYGNTLEGNAICGIWGGYARDSLIVDNDFRGNGGAGYGLERGGERVTAERHDALVTRTTLRRFDGHGELPLAHQGREIQLCAGAGALTTEGRRVEPHHRAHAQVVGALRDQQTHRAVPLQLQGEFALELQGRGEQHRRC